MLPSWGVGKSIGSQHLNSTCRHIICNSNTQMKLAEPDIRLQFAAKVTAKITAKNETWQLRRKPCKTKTIISTMAVNALQQLQVP